MIQTCWGEHCMRFASYGDWPWLSTRCSGKNRVSNAEEPRRQSQWERLPRHQVVRFGGRTPASWQSSTQHLLPYRDCGLCIRCWAQTRGDVFLFVEFAYHFVEVQMQLATMSSSWRRRYAVRAPNSLLFPLLWQRRYVVRCALSPLFPPSMTWRAPTIKRTLFTSGGFKTQGREEKILVIIMIQGMLSVTKTHAVSEPSAWHKSDKMDPIFCIRF